MFRIRLEASGPEGGGRGRKLVRVRLEAGGPVIGGLGLAAECEGEALVAVIDMGWANGNSKTDGLSFINSRMVKTAPVGQPGAKEGCRKVGL